MVVFVGGAWIMSAVSGRQTVPNQKPLNQRLGYDTEAVDRLFSVFYGTALAVSLMIASAMLGGPVHPVWLIVPVVLTVGADWVENLVHLDQLRNYIGAGKDGLVPGWIQVASTATIVKLLFFAISSLGLATLLITLVLRARSAQ